MLEWLLLCAGILGIFSSAESTITHDFEVTSSAYPSIQLPCQAMAVVYGHIKSAMMLPLQQVAVQV